MRFVFRGLAVSSLSLVRWVRAWINHGVVGERREDGGRVLSGMDACGRRMETFVIMLVGSFKLCRHGCGHSSSGGRGRGACCFCGAQPR